MTPRSRCQWLARAWPAALLVLLLGACASPPNTLTIAAALLPAELAAYRDVIAAFERSSNMHVIVVPQQYPEIRRALTAEATAGHGTLDLVELDVYSLSLAAPYVSVLDEQPLQPELDRFAAASLAAGRMDGRLRFLPHRVTWQAMIYNRAELGDPPRTWAEVLDVARRHPHRIGLKAAMYEGLTCDILPFVWTAGGSGRQLDDAGARAAFGFFAELAPYLHPQSATFKESTIAEAMARGEIVLHLNWPFVMSLYASQGLAPGTIQSAPLPRGPRPDDRATTVLGGGYLGIPRSSTHSAAALQLLRFLLERQQQQRLATELGWFSARDDVPVLGGNELLGGFTAMRDAVRARPADDHYPRLSRLWQEAFRAVAFEHADPVTTLERAAHDDKQAGVQ